MHVKNIEPNRIHPNEYNPNRMDDAELAELFAEVRHLGRLPKPVVVRRNGDGYTIVDGEHGWRAACEVGLETVPCEVIDGDDFECMRQTYKRNQHGTHNPVKLGQMFRRMMGDRDLSQRGLATEIGVSEGTVRNAVAYAEAVGVRNSYAPEGDGDAVDELSVRQVRAYLSLPEPIRDYWFDAGADCKAIDEALCVPETPGSKKLADWGQDDGFDTFGALVEAGLADMLRDARNSRSFVLWTHRAIRLFEWRGNQIRYCESIDEYIHPVIRLRLLNPVDELNRHLPCEADEHQRIMKVLITSIEWEQALDACAERTNDGCEWDEIIDAGVRVALRNAGLEPEDVADPRVVEMMDMVNAAPQWVRDADDSLASKVNYLRIMKDVPEEDAEEVIRRAEEIVKLRCDSLKHMSFRDKILYQMQVPTGLEPIVNEVVMTMNRDRESAAEKALYADRTQLMDRILEHAEQAHTMRTEELDGRPALEVMRERLSQMPWPEFRYLASFVLEDAVGAQGRWFQSVREEMGLPASEFPELIEVDEDEVGAADTVSQGE